MLRMLVGVRERMIELGIGKTPRMMVSREREQSGLAAGELEQRRAHTRSLTHTRMQFLVLERDSMAGSTGRERDDWPGNVRR